LNKTGYAAAFIIGLGRVAVLAANDRGRRGGKKKIHGPKWKRRFRRGVSPGIFDPDWKMAFCGRGINNDAMQL